MAENAHAHAHAHPNYVKIWGILVVLLVVSVLGPMIGIKAVTLITAFGIAVVKAYLVVKNFMHVNVEPRYVVYLLITGVGFMALLVFFISPDIMRHEGQQWENVAAKSVVAAGTEPEIVELPFDAEEAYTTVCAACHGPTGKGDGPTAAALTPKPADFSKPEFWASRDKDHLVTVIRDGGAAVGKSPAMAPYGAAYSEEEISAIADYLIATFQPEGAPTPAADDGLPMAGSGGAEGETEAATTGAGETDTPAADTEAVATGAGGTETPAADTEAATGEALATGEAGTPAAGTAEAPADGTEGAAADGGTAG